MIRAAACLAALVVLVAMGFGAGSAWQFQRDKALSAIAIAKAAKDAVATSEAARKTERTLAATLVATDITTRKANANEDRDHRDFSTRVRSGAVRVFIPASCPGPIGGTDPAASAEPDSGRAQLSGEVAQALDRIATEADALARERNQCIASYAAAQAAVSQQGLCACR